MALDAGGLDILLVENNPNDAELTLHACRNLTTQIHLVRDGAEAIDFLFGTGTDAGRGMTEKPKVILLDVKLPKIDGLEVLRQIKLNPRTSSIPVVLLTSSSEERAIIAGYSLGANSYIVKPVEFAGFKKVVHDLGLYWLTLNKSPIDRVA